MEIQQAAYEINRLRDLMDRHAALARVHKASWAQIGFAALLTPDAARKRWSGE
jgi:hypothetical protein